jgi:hypothetical protein
VYQRKEFTERLWAVGGYTEWTSDDIPILPWWRETLGDIGVEQIRVPFTHEAEFRSEAQRLFPEAAFNPISKDEIEQEQADRLKQLWDELKNQGP